MRLAVSLVVVVCACYSPAIPTGAPCVIDRDCPRGQICDQGSMTCERIPGDIDAAFDPDGDGGNPGVCDPDEMLIGGQCVIPLSAEVTAKAISAVDCDTEDANNGRSIALDRGNRIYVGFRCGGMNEAFVAVSSNGGGAVATPVSLGVTQVDRISLLGQARKQAYAAIAGNQGVTFARTTDGGATWTNATLETNRPDSGYGVALAAAGTNVYVAVKINPTTIRVWRNNTSGTGMFESLDVTLSTAFGEMLVDPANGDLWLGSDTPDLHLKRSTDNGQSFGNQIDPPGSYNFSDWTLGGGAIFATGTNNDQFSRIPLADPLAATVVNANLPGATSRMRTIAAATDETVYVASQSGMNVTTILRFPAGSTTSVTRTINNARAPHIVIGPSNAIPYSFTNSADNRVELGVAIF